MASDELPRIAGEGKRVRLVMGRAYGARSPVDFPHASLFAEAVLAPGAVLPLDPDYDERAVYVASGEIDIAGDTFGEGGCSCSGRATASRSSRMRSRG